MGCVGRPVVSPYFRQRQKSLSQREGGKEGGWAAACDLGARKAVGRPRSAPFATVGVSGGPGRSTRARGPLAANMPTDAILNAPVSLETFAFCSPVMHPAVDPFV